MVLSLFAISILVFVIMEVLPGDVATMILGDQATPEDLATLRVKLGLERPAHVRYLEWIARILRGDLGKSLRMKLPVASLVFQRLKNSAVLAAMTFVILVPTAVMLGTVAGLMRDRLPDTILTLGSLIVGAVPEFVSGVFLILVFASWLHVLPPSSVIPPEANPLQSIKHLILPAIALMMAVSAHILRMTRSSMIQVMESGYIRTAILKGLPMRTVVFKHALRNALLPTITLIAFNVGWLIGGLVVVENVFGYPGVGRLLLLAIGSRDVPLVEALVLLVGFAYAGSNFLADIAYAYLNPRIRYT